MIERLRRISYFFAYAVATIPLWHYIRDGRILALMITIVTFAYVMVVLNSIQVAQPILSSEKSKATLPRWLPDKPKYHKWWLLVRRTLKWHLLLVPPKLGIAVGIMQWLVYGRVVGGYVFHELLDYVSNNGMELPDLYPQWETFSLVFFLIMFFAVSETGLMVATICIAKSLSFKKQMVSVLIFRLMICISTIGFVFSLRILIFSGYTDNPVITRCHNPEYYLQAEEQESLPLQYYISCIKSKLRPTIYEGILTHFDNGILLSANMMRPISQLTWAERGYHYSDDDLIETWDNRLFVLRQIVAGLLGLMLYAGTTWVILWFVEDEVE